MNYGFRKVDVPGFVGSRPKLWKLGANADTDDCVAASAAISMTMDFVVGVLTIMVVYDCCCLMLT